MGDGQVAPFLVGVKPSDLPSPLTQFNAVFAEKTDFKRLLKAINARAADEAVDQPLIDKAIDALWSSIEKDLKEAEEPPSKSAMSKPLAIPVEAALQQLDPILQELLVLSRQQNLMLSKVFAAPRLPELEARRDDDRRVVSELLVELWDFIDDGPGVLTPRLLRLEEMMRITAHRLNLIPLANRRRRRMRSDVALRPDRMTKSVRYRSSKLSEVAIDEFIESVRSIAPVGGLSRGASDVVVTFSEPISESSLA